MFCSFGLIKLMQPVQLDITCFSPVVLDLHWSYILEYLRVVLRVYILSLLFLTATITNNIHPPNQAPLSHQGPLYCSKPPAGCGVGKLLQPRGLSCFRRLESDSVFLPGWGQETYVYLIFFFLN